MELTKSISEMTTEELEQLVAKRKQEEQRALQKAREEYERKVDETAKSIITEAIGLNKIMSDFYKDTTDKLIAMREKLNEYGKIRSSSKGGFQIKTADGEAKIVYKYSTVCDWDERAGKAEELLKDFLGDTVKKRDKDLHELIISLLEKNKEGKLELSRMQALYAKEALFTDPRWVEAIRLFKESFQPVDTKMRLEFYRRNETSNRFEPINLNLSGF